ncbi:MAG: hypothetical protein KBC62_04570 [Candidatus Pacebacteria bacterium]|nr:hypothetical protein [Candidatus Paceibacterota bacterium]
MNETSYLYSVELVLASELRPIEVFVRQDTLADKHPRGELPPTIIVTYFHPILLD